MNKNYDVKRAADAALRGLIRTIYENLNDEEGDKLCLELSLTLFTATLDFSLPVDKFYHEAQIKNIEYQLTLKDILIEVKADYDKGDINEADTF